MLAGIRLQQFPEVGAARAQHDLVCGKRPLVTGEGHVNKVLLLAQVTERGEDRGLEVVPFESVLLLGRRRRHGRLHFVAAVVVVQLVLLLLQESSGSAEAAAVRGTAVVVAVTVLLLGRRRSCGMKQS